MKKFLHKIFKQILLKTTKVFVVHVRGHSYKNIFLNDYYQSRTVLKSLMNIFIFNSVHQML